MENKTNINSISKIKKGSFFRIKYIVDVPVSADAKAHNIYVGKLVETTVRTGVNYGKIKKVIEKKQMNGVSKTAQEREPWYNWVVPNTIAQHKKTGDFYLAVMPIAHGSNKNTKYFVSQGSKNSLVSSKSFSCDFDFVNKTNVVAMNVVLPSYWKKLENEENQGVTPFQFIKLTNILEIK